MEQDLLFFALAFLRPLVEFFVLLMTLEGFKLVGLGDVTLSGLVDTILRTASRGAGQAEVSVDLDVARGIGVSRRWRRTAPEC
jgi:hypothetical protein